MQVKFSIFGTNETIVTEASKLDTVEEVLNKVFRETNKSQKATQKRVVLFNGKIVNTFLTFETLGIHNNNTLVLYQKKTSQKIMQFFIEPTAEERQEQIESSVIGERCRLADLGFNGWECDQKGGQIIRDAYEAEQAILAVEDAESHNFELFMDKTIISHPAEICEKPLPFYPLLSD